MKVKGAEIIVKTLIDEGVDIIFGYPGGAVIQIFDALYDYEDKLRLIRTSHEQGAVHAADGYARSSGKTGVVIATSGPGATNIVTGLATAFMDSIPLVCITGNANRKLIGKDSFQEIDIMGITMPITKHNFVVRDIRDLQNTLKRAFLIAQSGRKGPVLVDIPSDITGDFIEYVKKDIFRKERNFEVSDNDIKKIASYINNAKRPIIYSGGGVTSSESFKELRQLIHKSQIPACNTIMGIGVLGYEDELNLGMVGMHGKYSTNNAIDECDLLIACGVRFSDRVALNTKKFAKDAKIIHIDIDKSEIDKNIFVDFGLVGDVKEILNKLLPCVEKRERKDWISRINDLRKKDFKAEDSKELLKPHQVIKHISNTLGDDLIFVTDVGQHQMWTAQYCGRTKPRSFLTSGGLGTMGFGYGAAMGAKLANPNRPVVLITGDGSFNMNFNEVLTAVNENIKVITVVMNNNTLGMVRQWQHLLYKDRFSKTNIESKLNYVILAQAMGAKGFSACTIKEFKDCFDKAIKIDGPSIIEVKINTNELVLPMIPAGGSVDDVIME
ncbi:biosynthetic-type acetolactate synthase large subunit [Anaerococcus sp. AGMB00486]|uniref:Acetolactate synthase n=1 Tax=Anaerococcus faecalis TaxID=2742993 RepID=A0ABX2NBR3_9FIRM|nr:biosynthetic-type acetolactate synthase large subunit [Anaerococcus faecalis]NVF12123.1 biosynthetic-type acetolactate synthase large subunit [Anaerococcus faecalis]